MTGTLSAIDPPVSYDRPQIVHNIRFSLPPGQATGFIGPNGIGRSMLFGAVASLVPSTCQLGSNDTELDVTHDQ